MKHFSILFLMCAGVMAQTPTATIHVYRPNGFFGIGSHPAIYCDGIELTRLYRDSIFTTELPPGKHMITGGRSEVGEFLDLEPGKVYYLRFGFKKSRHFSGHEPFALTLVSEVEALHEMSK
jgi:hypothetical protein